MEKSDQEFIKQYFEDRDFFQVNFLIKNFEICQKIFSSTKETEIFATREINLIKNHSFFLGLRSINNTIDLNKLELDNFRNIYRKRVHYESRNHEIKWTYARIPKYGDI